MAQARLNSLVPRAFIMVAELDRRARISRNDLPKLVAPLDQRQPAQIGAIKEQQVEGKQLPVGGSAESTGI
jgi:hypothetical protein